MRIGLTGLTFHHEGFRLQDSAGVTRYRRSVWSDLSEGSEGWDDPVKSLDHKGVDKGLRIKHRIEYTSEKGRIKG